MLFIALCVYESVLPLLGPQSCLPGTTVIIWRAAQRYRQTAGRLVCGSSADTHVSLNVTFNWMSHRWNNARQYWSMSAAMTGCERVNKISKLGYQQLLNKDKYPDKREQKGNLHACVRVCVWDVSPCWKHNTYVPSWLLKRRCCHILKVSEKVILPPNIRAKSNRSSFFCSLTCASMHHMSHILLFSSLMHRG